MIRLQKVWREAWRKPDAPPITRWAAERFLLSGQVEATRGPYNLRKYPYLIEILESWEDPETEKISIMASTQVGKTLLSIVCLAYVADTDPAPALICTPNQAATTEFRDRFYANCLESPTLRGRVPSEKKWNTRHIELERSRIYLAWAGSRQRLRGRACRYVVLSEIDVYQKTMAGDPIRVAEERTKKFYRRTILQESSPVGEDSPIAAEYEAGDQRRWHCKCPTCGRYQELRFFKLSKGELAGRGGLDGYRGGDGEFLPVEEARAAVHYLCLNGCKIYDDQKRDFVETGLWVRDGQKIDCNGKLQGQPKRSARNASFHLWSVHSDTITFADIAEAHIRHHDGGQIGDFWQNWLGLKYSTAKRVPRWARVGRMLAGDHGRGEVWPQGWFLSAGADVQGDGVYWVVRAWGHQMASWLVDWGFLQRYRDQEQPEGLSSDLDQLSLRLLDRRWPVVDGQETPLGAVEVGVKLLNIDANYRTTDVGKWLASLSSRKRVRAIMGDTFHVKMAERFRRTRIERTSQKRDKRGMEVWRINVNAFKEDLMSQIVAGCDGRDRLFQLTSDVSRTGAIYLKQLVNEQKRAVEDKWGRTKMEWVVRSQSTGNHYWDCEIYARAAADMVLAEQQLTWNSETWPRPGRVDSEPAELLTRTARE